MRLPGLSLVLMLLGLILSLLWGVYILAGLGLGGYGPHASARLLTVAVVPPVVASLLLLVGGLLALRRRRGARLSFVRGAVAVMAILLGTAVGALAFVVLQAGR